MLMIILNILVLFFVNIDSVPPDYCLQPINLSDCGVPPKPVYYYYKPGSRCEIAFWRGCSSYNKFDTEYNCSDTCIARLGAYSDSEENAVNTSYTWTKEVVTTEKAGIFQQWIDNLNALTDEEAMIIKIILDSLDDNAISDLPIIKLKQISTTAGNIEKTTITSPMLMITETIPIEPTEHTTEPLSTTTSTTETTTSTTELVMETTTKVIETTTEAVETTTEAVEITTEAVETTTEAIETTTQAAKTTKETTTTTETEIGDAQEVITT
ncbi:uncharacterized protein LOC131854653 [Achroia grisella]|uniref:uncharacterized protein LOC131854653 n=1 Tax=Achroia grisella TaxID=688607 RepID=UPI0027D27790|nr:uncharacterized protein LOC131854653 [Achroia grisella]